MRTFIWFAALVVILLVIAAPTSSNIPITKVQGLVKANSYITAIFKKACTQHVSPEIQLHIARLAKVTNSSQRRQNNVQRDSKFRAEGITKLNFQIFKPCNSPKFWVRAIRPNLAIISHFISWVYVWNLACGESCGFWFYFMSHVPSACHFERRSKWSLGMTGLLKIWSQVYYFSPFNMYAEGCFLTHGWLETRCSGLKESQKA